MNIRTTLAILIALPLLAPGASAATLLGESFEAGATPFAWSLSGMWEVNSCNAKDSVYALNYARPSLACTYDAGASSGLAKLPAFVIGSGWFLVFDSFIDTEFAEEWSTCNFDVADVVISTDGGANFVPLLSNVQCGTQEAWTLQVVSLAAYEGQNAIIAFSFNTGDGSFNGYSGWSVDNVLITDAFVPTPELPALGLMAAGAGLVGFVALRRRN